MLLVFIQILANLAASLIAFADAPDPIQVRLASHQKAYEDDSAKIKQRLIDDLKAKIDEGKSAGDTDVVNVVSAEKAAFEANGALPHSKTSRRIVDKYENDLYALMQRWKFEMETVQKDYTKAGKQEKANHLKAEVEAFQKVIEARFPDRKRRENKIINGKFEAKWQSVQVFAGTRLPNKLVLSEMRPNMNVRKPSRAVTVNRGRLSQVQNRWIFLSLPRPESFNHAIENDGGKAGPRCLIFSGDGNFGALYSPAVVSDFKRRYTACGWARVDNSAKVSIVFEYFDSNGDLIINHSSSEVGAVGMERENGWQYLEINDRLDEFPEAKSLRLALKVIGTGTAWFDDVQLLVAKEE